MKRIYYASLILICVAVFGKTKLLAQTIKPTTQDEYTYGTVGYKMQLQMKLRMINGYSLEDLSAFEEGDRKMNFKGLYRTGEKIPCAILMVYFKVRSAPEYFCMPTKDAPQDMWSSYFNSLKSENENEEERYRFFTKSLAKLSMELND